MFRNIWVQIMAGCEDFEADLSAFLDGELTAQEKSALEQHLSGCLACRRTLETLRTVSGAVGDVPRVKAPPSLLEKVRKDVANEPALRERVKADILMLAPPESDARRRAPWASMIFGLAALVLLCLLAFVILPAVSQQMTPLETAAVSQKDDADLKMGALSEGEPAAQNAETNALRKLEADAKPRADNNEQPAADASRPAASDRTEKERVATTIYKAKTDGGTVSKASPAPRPMAPAATPAPPPAEKPAAKAQAEPLGQRQRELTLKETEGGNNEVSRRRTAVVEEKGKAPALDAGNAARAARNEAVAGAKDGLPAEKLRKAADAAPQELQKRTADEAPANQNAVADRAAEFRKTVADKSVDARRNTGEAAKQQQIQQEELADAKRDEAPAANRLQQKGESLAGRAAPVAPPAPSRVSQKKAELAATAQAPAEKVATADPAAAAGQAGGAGAQTRGVAGKDDALRAKSGSFIGAPPAAPAAGAAAPQQTAGEIQVVVLRTKNLDLALSEVKKLLASSGARLELKQTERAAAADAPAKKSAATNAVEPVHEFAAVTTGDVETLAARLQALQTQLSAASFGAKPAAAAESKSASKPDAEQKAREPLLKEEQPEKQFAPAGDANKNAPERRLVIRIELVP
ncbi:MAG TPA: zf-HC2 domain-containing protein [Planctomycetota bacterium]|nr:zf-HC2 domain-containing protein [Planctomycetota bacterium]